MKVIDLLNKIANGQINEDALIEFDNGYDDYCSVRVFFDRYIMNRENLNCEVEVIEKDKKMEKYNHFYNKDAIEDYKLARFNANDMKEICNRIGWLMENNNSLGNKINEIIDKINIGD